MIMNKEELRAHKIYFILVMRYNLNEKTQV